MADDIEFHCYPETGQVTLTCGAEAFARVWAAVVREAGPTDGTPHEVRMVLIERVHPDRPPTRWRDGLGLLGCGVVGFAVLFVLAIGVGTITGWVRYRNAELARCGSRRGRGGFRRTSLTRRLSGSFHAEIRAPGRAPCRLVIWASRTAITCGEFPKREKESEP